MNPIFAFVYDNEEGTTEVVCMGAPDLETAKNDFQMVYGDAHID